MLIISVLRIYILEIIRSNRLLHSRFHKSAFHILQLKDTNDFLSLLYSVTRNINQKLTRKISFPGKTPLPPLKKVKKNSFETKIIRIIPLICSQKRGKKRKKKHLQTFALFSHSSSATRTDRIPSGMEKANLFKKEKKGEKKKCTDSRWIYKTQPPYYTRASNYTRSS